MVNSNSFYGKRKQQNFDSDNHLSENHSDISNTDDSEDDFVPDNDVSSTDSDLEKDVMVVMLKNLRSCHIKPGLREPQLPVQSGVTLVSSIVVERHCCGLKSAASLDYNRRNKRDAPRNWKLRFV